jgi:hypothetical protein
MTCPSCGQRLMRCSQPPVGHDCDGPLRGMVHALTNLHACTTPPGTPVSPPSAGGEEHQQ